MRYNTTLWVVLILGSASLTAHAFAEEQQDILGAGCDDIILKPFQERDIFASMSRFLEVQYSYEDSLKGYQERELNGTAKNRMDLQIIQDENVTAQWLDDIEKALMELDSQRISGCVGYLPQDHPAKEAMATLAYNFQYDVLLDMVRSAQLNGDDNEEQ